MTEFTDDSGFNTTPAVSSKPRLSTKPQEPKVDIIPELLQHVMKDLPEQGVCFGS